MKKVTVNVYSFDELQKDVQDAVIEKRISEMVEYEWEDHYENWPEFKKAIDRSEQLQTPWFTGAYVWDNCKKEILQELAQWQYFKDGKIYTEQ